MFYLVETKDQLERLSVYHDKPCFLEVIPLSEDIHPALNRPSLIYYRPLTSKKGFIFCIDHTESMSIEYNDVIAFVESLEAEIWTIDKKTTLYYGIPERLLKGLKLAYTLSNFADFPSLRKEGTSAHNFYRKKLYSRTDYNRFIPISKHYEKYESYFKNLNFNIKANGFDFYNDLISNIFKKIEEVGIGIAPSFKKSNKDFHPYKNVKNGKIYSWYNIYNHTSRPSCNYNGINFLAFNKSDDSRKEIIPYNDILLDIDYKSYQIKLLADFIGFDISGNIHMELAKQYFPDRVITPELYEESKKKTFHYVFGNDSNIPDIDFFKKVYDIKHEMWNNYQKYGFITSPISGREIRNIDEITQIIPYLTQCIETERNAIVIDSLLDLLNNYQTKLILYCYDSFLLDFSFDDGKDLIFKIKDILTENRFDISIKYGDNYGELQEFTLSDTL